MEWKRASNDSIDEAFAHFFGLSTASLAQVCQLIIEVDSRQSWMIDGARSLADWVSARLDIRPENARSLVRVALRLIDLPVLSARFAEGSLSFDQVDAISRMATPENEETLIDEAMGLSSSALDRASRRAMPPSPSVENSVWDRRALYLQWNLDQSELSLRGTLPGAQGEVVQNAVEAAADQLGPNPDTERFDPYPKRLADGLVEVAATTSGDVSSPPQMTIHADLEALTSDSVGVTELGHGGLVPNETARRLGCDAVVETFVYSEKAVVGVGRNRRTVPGWLRRLICFRDGYGCRFPGCSNTRWLQIHHIHHWAHGGATDSDNLILLCGHHHRFLHEHPWHITGDPNESVVFRKPDWAPYPRPKPPLEPRLAVLSRSM